MKVFIATDHTGLDIKNKVKDFLEDKGHEVEDCGAYELNLDDDYPDFIGKAAEGVSQNPESIGIIFGGSGQGEAMVANKFKNVRCALFYTPAVPVQAIDITGKKSTDPFEMLRLTREHNHANMVSLGVRFLTEDDIFKAVEIFVNAEIAMIERHTRRVDKIRIIENKLDS